MSLQGLKFGVKTVIESRLNHTQNHTSMCFKASFHTAGPVDYF